MHKYAVFKSGSNAVELMTKEQVSAFLQTLKVLVMPQITDGKEMIVRTVTGLEYTIRLLGAK